MNNNTSTEFKKVNLKILDSVTDEQLNKLKD